LYGRELAIVKVLPLPTTTRKSMHQETPAVLCCIYCIESHLTLFADLSGVLAENSVLAAELTAKGRAQIDP
jgi:hypothetical protein